MLRSLTYCLFSVSVLLCFAGCHLLQINPGPKDLPEPQNAAYLPSKNSFRVGQFMFLADVEIKRNSPIFKELSNLRDQVQRDLQLPTSNSLILVYLFEDKERYERFMQMRYPDLPKRRAFFVAQPHRFGASEDLLVFTYWGDRVAQDLRHELTHALLHSVLKDMPLWLDEGLAEYYELPPAANGVSLHHLDNLRRPPNGPMVSDLTRLEQLLEVQHMTPVEYRESWAWVHFFLRGAPQARQVLLDYLKDLRTTSRPGSLRQRLVPVLGSPEEALQRHLTDLDQSTRRRN